VENWTKGNQAMNRSLSTLTATAFLLALTAGMAQAQTSGDDTTQQGQDTTQQPATTQEGQGMMQEGQQGESMMPQDRQRMRKHRKYRDRYSGNKMHHGMGQGMMGQGMMGQGMMGQGMMGQGMMGHGGMGHRAVMQVIFAITDANGDGTLSLQEVQDTHARIFAHMDGDDDGQVTKREIRAFFRGGRGDYGSGGPGMSGDDMSDDSGATENLGMPEDDNDD
jgi:hypothetical protein